jgi:hypothetical protein
VRLDGSVHAECVLEDPIAGKLEGIQVFAWWQMLWRFRNHAITIVEGKGAPTSGSATWKLGYTHPSTRRAMLVHVASAFEFKQNKIARQKDSYGVYNYLRQALGTQGVLLGWLPPMQWQLRGAVRDRLEEFMDRQGITEGHYLLGAVKQKRRGDSIPDVGDVSYQKSIDNF